MQTVRERLPTELTFVISDAESEWRDLEQLIRASNPSKATLHIRGFSAIEWVYLRTIPTLLFAVGRKDIYEIFEDVEIPRSVDGLAALTGLLDQAHRRTGALRTVLAVKRERTNSSQQQSALLEKPNKLIADAARAVEVLSHSLRNNDVRSIHRLGALLGQSYIDMAEGPSEVQSHLRSLLSITMDAPESPWQKSKPPQD